ncbi:ATP-binding protein [Planctomycetota bacterium]
MDDLVALSRYFLKQADKPFHRQLPEADTRTGDFERPCTLVVGQRGVGKTTLILQHLQYLRSLEKENVAFPTTLYVPCDHYLIQGQSLYDIAETFSLHGGQIICFDEIHKYTDWAKELKSILDTFKALRVIGTGSSAIEIKKASHDLTRRAINLELLGLSFREFIALETGIVLESTSLATLLNSHADLAETIVATLAEKDFKVIGLFDRYLKIGFFPYYQDYPNRDDYYLTLQQNLDRSLEGDLLAVYPALTGSSIRKIRKLITRISERVPFSPDVRKLAKQLSIGDERTLYDYLSYLQATRIIRQLPPKGSLSSEMTKPEKIFLDNPNLMYALAFTNQVDQDCLRETFFYSTVSPVAHVSAAHKGDFWVNKQFTFEVGGKGKTMQQIQGEKDAYLAVDSIEVGAGKKIPLWLFGFLY